MLLVNDRRRSDTRRKIYRLATLALLVGLVAVLAIRCSIRPAEPESAGVTAERLARQIGSTNIQLGPFKRFEQSVDSTAHVGPVGKRRYLTLPAEWDIEGGGPLVLWRDPVRPASWCKLYVLANHVTSSRLANGTTEVVIGGDEADVQLDLTCDAPYNSGGS